MSGYSSRIDSVNDYVSRYTEKADEDFIDKKEKSYKDAMAKYNQVFAGIDTSNISDMLQQKNLDESIPIFLGMGAATARTALGKKTIKEIGIDFQQEASKLKEGVEKSATELGEKVKKGISSVREGVSEGASNVRSGLSEGVDNVKSGLSEGVDNVKSGLSEGVANVRQGVKGGDIELSNLNPDSELSNIEDMNEDMNINFATRYPMIDELPPLEDIEPTREPILDGYDPADRISGNLKEDGYPTKIDATRARNDIAEPTDIDVNPPDEMDENIDVAVDRVKTADADTDWRSWDTSKYNENDENIDENIDNVRGTKIETPYNSNIMGGDPESILDASSNVSKSAFAITDAESLGVRAAGKVSSIGRSIASTASDYATKIGESTFGDIASAGVAGIGAGVEGFQAGEEITGNKYAGIGIGGVEAAIAITNPELAIPIAIGDVLAEGFASLFHHHHKKAPPPPKAPNLIPPPVIAPKTALNRGDVAVPVYNPTT